MSLARKYRPQKFGDLVGQDPVAKALLHCVSRLRHAGDDGRNHKEVPQAFIFSGIRGTGKTTLARLYAAAVNCQNDSGFEQCGDPDCPSCEKLGQGQHEDILEIDGASHNSVEDVRKLQETLLYSPRSSAKKVYIIDEVHMLSTSAFNALLKTLEEPPQHVIFLLATTELHKLPATVISRCQTFHLRRIPPGVMIPHLEKLLKIENITYEEKALGLIAEHSEGSMRDGLSLLDQMIALGGGKIDYATSLQLMEFAPINDFYPLWSAVLLRHMPEWLQEMSRLLEKGYEAQMIARQLLKVAHKTSIVLALPEGSDAFLRLDIRPEEHTEIRSVCTEARKIHGVALDGRIRDFIRSVGELFAQFSGGAIDRLLLENMLMEWIFSDGLLADQPQKPSGRGPRTQAPSPPPPKPTQVPEQMKVSGATSLPPSWQGLIDALKGPQPIQANALSYARVIEYSADNIALAVVKDDDRLNLKSKEAAIKDALQQHFGFRGSFSITVMAPEKTSAGPEAVPLSIGESSDLASRREKQQFEAMIHKTELARKMREHFPSSTLTIEHQLE